MCKLCFNEPPIENSHILSEFNYNLLYDSKHRVVQVSTDEKEKPEFLQKGLREPLLGNNCEKKLAIWEDYAKRTLYGEPAIINQSYQDFMTSDGGMKYTLVKGVDYKKFKLYLLSLLWRSSISKLSEFGEIALGPHEEKIRDMIYREDPGDKINYGCLVIALLDDNGKPIEGVIINPDSMKIYGNNCCRFIISGFCFVFFISKHNIPEFINDFFLDQSNELKILHQRGSEHTELLSGLADKITKRKDYPQLLKKI